MARFAYTENFTQEFNKCNIAVPQIPTPYIIADLKVPLKAFNFETADSYFEYLDKEHEFWSEFSDHVFFKTYVNAYHNAKAHLKEASLSYGNGIQSYLNSSINAISLVPFSDTVLAKELIKHKKESGIFFAGFLAAITNDDVSLGFRSVYLNSLADETVNYIHILPPFISFLISPTDYYFVNKLVQHIGREFLEVEELSGCFD